MRCYWISLLFLVLTLFPLSAMNVRSAPMTTLEGYLTALLINEVAFPGERGYISEKDTMRGMENILLVLDSRIYYVPPLYSRQHIAQTSSDKLIDIITAGGVHGQVEGFFLNEEGIPTALPRVGERIQYLLTIAEDGPPGRFARLLNHAGSLAKTYVAYLQRPENLYANLRFISGVPVTGRAYSWTTDHHHFHPGGNYIKIPNDYRGSLSGNRFFSLRNLNP